MFTEDSSMGAQPPPRSFGGVMVSGEMTPHGDARQTAASFLNDPLGEDSVDVWRRICEGENRTTDLSVRPPVDSGD